MRRFQTAGSCATHQSNMEAWLALSSVPAATVKPALEQARDKIGTWLSYAVRKRSA